LLIRRSFSSTHAIVRRPNPSRRMAPTAGARWYFTHVRRIERMVYLHNAAETYAMLSIKARLWA